MLVSEPSRRASVCRSGRFEDLFVRTDSNGFRLLKPDSDRTKELRALTRAREHLVHMRVGLANQLREDCFFLAPCRQGVLGDRHADRARVPSSRTLVGGSLLLGRVVQG